MFFMQGGNWYFKVIAGMEPAFWKSIFCWKNIFFLEVQQALEATP